MPVWRLEALSELPWVISLLEMSDSGWDPTPRIEFTNFSDLNGGVEVFIRELPQTWNVILDQSSRLRLLFGMWCPVHLSHFLWAPTSLIISYIGDGKGHTQAGVRGPTSTHTEWEVHWLPSLSAIPRCPLPVKSQLSTKWSCIPWVWCQGTVNYLVHGLSVVLLGYGSLQNYCKQPRIGMIRLRLCSSVHHAALGFAVRERFSYFPGLFTFTTLWWSYPATRPTTHELNSPYISYWYVRVHRLLRSEWKVLIWVNCIKLKMSFLIDMTISNNISNFQAIIQ